MPIKACADKLAREMEQFGYPPQFPVDDGSPVDEEPKVNLLKTRIKTCHLFILSSSTIILFPTRFLYYKRLGEGLD